MQNHSNNLKGESISKEKVKKYYQYPFDEIKQVKIDVNEAKSLNIYYDYSALGYIVISAFVPQVEGVKFENHEEWLEAMTERTKELRQLVRRSAYHHTHVWGEYMYGTADFSATKTPVRQVSFIVFNSVRQNITRGAELKTTIKEFGQKWCREFEQKAFLYVPSRKEKTIDNPGYNPAYLIDGDGKTKDVFSSVALVPELDKFFKLLNREMNDDNSPEHHFTYQDGFLYFGKRPYGMSQFVRRDGECYCEIVNQAD